MTAAGGKGGGTGPIGDIGGTDAAIPTDAPPTCTNGSQCPAPGVCANGRCFCGAGILWCGTRCLDGAYDNQNCGACGVVCAAGQACVGSICR